MKDLHWTTSGLQSQWESTPEPPQKMFLSENVIFRGLRLSLGHFGQQVPDSSKMVYQHLLYLLSLWTY